MVELTAVPSPVQRIAKAFGVDPLDNGQAGALSIESATLETVFDQFLEVKDRVSAPPEPAGPTAEEKAEMAEGLKQKGNSFLSEEDYDEAVESYTKAIELNPTNPVYYSNRATAHSHNGNHSLAIDDAEKAIELSIPCEGIPPPRVGPILNDVPDQTLKAAGFCQQRTLLSRGL